MRMKHYVECNPFTINKSEKMNPFPSQNSYFLRGSFWSIAQTGTRMVTALITVPLALGYLGIDRYGLWMTALSIISFVTFLDAGLTPTILNRMAEAFASNNSLKFKYYSSGGMVIGLCLFLIGLIVSICALMINWGDVLKVTDPLARREAGALVSILLFLSFGSLALATVENIYAARMRISKPKIYGTLASVAGFGLFVLGINLQFGLAALAFLNLCPLLFYRIVLLFEIMLTEPYLIIPRPKELADMAKELLPVSVLFMGIQLAAVIFTSVPNIIIARTLGVGDVTVFSVSYRICSVPLSLLAGLFPVFWPAFTIAWKKEDLAQLRKWIFFAILATTIILGVYAGLIAIFGKQLIRLWTLGKVDPSSILLILLGAWMVIQAVVHWVSTFLHSITDFRFEIVSYGLSATLLLISCWPLAQYFGVDGVAASMVLALFLGSLFPMIMRVKAKLSFTLNGIAKCS